jgi:hypothetical protein
MLSACGKSLVSTMLSSDLAHYASDVLPIARHSHSQHTQMRGRLGSCMGNERADPWCM